MNQPTPLRPDIAYVTEIHRDEAPWMDQAACATFPPALADEMWFDTTVAGKGRREALRICDTCPVITECLTRTRTLQGTYGISLSGVWAGRYLGGPTNNGTAQRARKALKEVEQ